MVTFPSFYARFARFVIALLRFCLDENGKLFFARLQFFFFKSHRKVFCVRGDNDFPYGYLIEGENYIKE